MDQGCWWFPLALQVLHAGSIVMTNAVIARQTVVSLTSTLQAAKRTRASRLWVAHGRLLRSYSSNRMVL
jgi:hypothetical protein